MTPQPAPKSSPQAATAPPSPSTTAVGRTAESLAAAHLEHQGFQVLDRNWRNRWCELDIVAQDASGDIHFVEVKYRRNIAYGYAAEYISHDKAARLMRAALAWNQAHQYYGPYQISVSTVEGALSAPTINFLPNVISA